METFVWCAIGAVLGLGAGRLWATTTSVVMAEDVLVGVFGAFVGAAFLVPMLFHTVPVLGVRGIAMAVGGAVLALVLLKLMRRAVGPMRMATKKRRHLP